MSKRLGKWLLDGEHGTSSLAIAGMMLGALPEPNGWPSHPRDPDDLFRCVKLLSQVPQWQHRIGEMAVVSKEWAALAGHWDELVQMLRAEIMGAGTGRRWSAPETYRRMSELIEGAQTEGVSP